MKIQCSNQISSSKFFLNNNVIFEQTSIGHLFWLFLFFFFLLSNDYWEILCCLFFFVFYLMCILWSPLYVFNIFIILLLIRHLSKYISHFDTFFPNYWNLYFFLVSALYFNILYYNCLNWFLVHPNFFFVCLITNDQQLIKKTHTSIHSNIRILDVGVWLLWY